MKTRLRIMFASVALLAAAACGSSSSGGAPSTGSASGGAPGGSGHTVTIKNFSFTPASLTVKVGTKVTFINQDSTPHTATSQGGSTIHSATLSKGQSYTVTFTKPGTYNYICSIHPSMKGTVIVQ
jgi:amicyanin